MVSYEVDVAPILREHCLKCHGDDTQKADLNLQGFASALKGGSGGEVVVAGRPSASTLYQAIAREGDAAPMPPNRPRIADAQVAVVRRWIAEGLRETSSAAPAIPTTPPAPCPPPGRRSTRPTTAGPTRSPRWRPARGLPSWRSPATSGST